VKPFLLSTRIILFLLSVFGKTGMDLGGLFCYAVSSTMMLRHLNRVVEGHRIVNTWPFAFNLFIFDLLTD